jgi:hypothetical protein
MIGMKFAKMNTETHLPVGRQLKASGSSLGQDVVIFQEGFTVIPNPTPCYLAGTDKVDFSALADFTSVTSVTDGVQTVTFDETLEKRQVPNTWGTWSSPPFSESPTPAVLFNPFDSTLTLTLSQPSEVFGFELEPNAFGFYTYTAEFFSGAVSLGSITQTVEGFAGARLYAASTEPITRVEISGEDSSGFAIAQLRYAIESPFCEDFPVDRVIPFSCTIDTEFEVIGLGTPELAGFNEEVECSIDTCLLPVDIPLPDNTTINCCIEVDTVNYNGSARLLLTVPATFDIDCPGPQDVELYCAADVDIEQTCFSCLGEGVCAESICDLLALDTIAVTQTGPNQIIISGSLIFNCADEED